MKLTHKQELLVTRYLREVGARLGDVPEATREQALLRLKARIAQECENPASVSLGDADVLAVLHRFGPPSKVAREILDRPMPSPHLAASMADVRLLGVCGGIAERFEVSARWVRAAFLAPALVGPAVFAIWFGERLASFITALLEEGAKADVWLRVPPMAFSMGMIGPLMVILYLAAYFEMYWTATPGDIRRIEKLKLAKATLGALLAGGALYAGSRGVLALIPYMHARFMEKSIPALGQWGWLEPNGAWLFVGVLCALMPVAVLSGLPLANRWDQTITRVVQAGLAVYALVLCLGIASALAGVILLVVEEFTN